MAASRAPTFYSADVEHDITKECIPACEAKHGYRCMCQHIHGNIYPKSFARMEGMSVVFEDEMPCATGTDGCDGEEVDMKVDGFVCGDIRVDVRKKEHYAKYRSTCDHHIYVEQTPWQWFMECNCESLGKTITANLPKELIPHLKVDQTVVIYKDGDPLVYLTHYCPSCFTFSNAFYVDRSGQVKKMTQAQVTAMYK